MKEVGNKVRNQIEDLILLKRTEAESYLKKLESFSEKHDRLKETLDNIDSKTEEIQKSMSDLDEQKHFLEEFIENANYVEMTEESIAKDIVKARDPISEKITHYWAKEQAIQDCLLQLKQRD